MSQSSKLVIIMMATYNGEKFLAEQLDSLVNQSHVNWRLIVSDDGSTDRTLEIIENYRKVWGSDRIKIVAGPRKGYAQNFLSMACNQELRADYYAFCDQDDVWLVDKLANVVKCLEGQNGTSIPHVYCGRTIYVREDGTYSGCSPEFVNPPSFQNALVQSIAGGNTMIFNQAAKNLVELTGSVPTQWHDWWVYQLVTGAGGKVLYDPIPQVMYRQHTNAIVGGSTSFLTRVRRLKRAFMGEFSVWSEQHLACLRMSYAYLNESSRETLECFMAMRSAKFMDRYRLFKRSGLYRQSWLGSKTLMLEALLKKI